MLTIFIHNNLLAKLFANTVFLMHNVCVVLSKKTLGRLQKFCGNKESPMIAYKLKHQKKKKKNGDFRSMSFKELAFHFPPFFHF